MGKIKPPRAVVHLADAPQHAVDAQKIGVRILRRVGEQETPLAAAEIDFETPLRMRKPTAHRQRPQPFRRRRRLRPHIYKADLT